MTTLIALTLLGTSLFTNGLQDEPHVGPSIPAAGKSTYTLSDLSGRIEFSWTSKDAGQIEWMRPIMEYCANYCRGNKHFEHRVCDTSCDSPCRGSHVFDLEPSLGGDFAESDGPISKAIERAAAQFGAPGNGSSAEYTLVGDATNKVNNDPRYVIKRRMNCWNDKPCSSSQLSFAYRKRDIVVKWRLYRETPRPDGTIYIVEGPKGESKGSLYLPVDLPPQKTLRIRCGCDIVERDADGKPVVDPNANPSTTPPPTTPPVTPDPNKPKEVGMIPGSMPNSVGYVGNTAATGSPVVKKFLTQLGFAVVCSSLTTASVMMVNNTNSPIRITLNAGTMFVCVKGGAQDVILVQDLRMLLPAGGQVEVPVLSGPNAGVQIGRTGTRDPNAPTPMPMDARVLCLDIDKPAPTVADTFDIALPPSESLSAIARKTANQLVQGPWDQARIWIARSGSTYETVNERLIPRISQAEYLRSAYECAAWGAIDFSKDLYGSCLEPKFALDVEAGPAALQWFARTLGKRGPAGLAEFINSHQADFAAKYSEARGQDHIERVTALANGLLETRDPACTNAAWDLLLKGTPEAGRPRFAAYRGVLPIRNAMLSMTDAASASKALDVVEALKIKALKFACLNLNASLPQAIRDRGKAIAKTL